MYFCSWHSYGASKQLSREVDAIVHSAASVVFDAPLPASLDTTGRASGSWDVYRSPTVAIEPNLRFSLEYPVLLVLQLLASPVLVVDAFSLFRKSCIRQGPPFSSSAATA
jgi:hypothetical protein